MPENDVHDENPSFLSHNQGGHLGTGMDCEKITECKLIDLIKEKHEQAEMAFEYFVERHRTSAFRVAYRKTLNRHDAEDVVQEAFFAIFNTVAMNGFKYRYEGCLAAYLYRIIRNKSTNVIRDRDQQKNRHDKYSTSLTERISSQEPTSQLEVNERLGQIRRIIEGALSQLESDHCRVICLRLVEQLSYAEIAATLNKNKSQIRKWVSRDRKRLCGLLSDYEDHENVL